MKPNPKEVGQRIRLLRKQLGLSLVEFGNRIGDVKRSAVGNWERGDNLPNNARLKRIAELGNTTVEELLYGSIHEYVSGIVKANMKSKPNNWASVRSLTNRLLLLNRWGSPFPSKEEVIAALRSLEDRELDRKEREILRFGKELYELTSKRNEILTDWKKSEKLSSDEKKRIDEVSKHLKEVLFLYESQYGLSPQEAFEEYESLFSKD